MGVRVTVNELVEAVEDTYSAIDIRTAAVLAEEEWVSVLTVVRLTYEEPVVVAERLRALERRHGKVETRHFRIVMDTRPFLEWKNLCDEVAGGVLRIGGNEMKLRQSLALNNQANQLDWFYSDIRAFDGITWPNLRILIGRHDGTELTNELVTREVGTLSYPDAYEAINALCEVNVRAGQSPGFDLYLSLPAFARVDNARLTPLVKRLDVTVSRHPTLRNIKGVVIHRGEQAFAGQPCKARLTIDSFERRGESCPLETVTGAVQLGEIEQEDWVEVRLTHPELGEIDGSFTRPLRSLIPPAERNPLFEAIKCFCPEVEIRRSLVHAYEKKSVKLKTSAAFEVRVAWLLGLFGCSTVILGEYEHLFAPESNVQLGSVDILALTPGKVLLLVGCALTRPSEKDFNNLREVQEMLRQTPLKDTNCRILPVFFTAAAGCPTYSEDEFLDCIPVVDAEGMDALVALLGVGREKDFFDFLGNPHYSPLRRP